MKELLTTTKEAIGLGAELNDPPHIPRPAREHKIREEAIHLQLLSVATKTPSIN